MSLVEFVFRSAVLALGIDLVLLVGIALDGSFEWAANGLGRRRDRCAVAALDGFFAGALWIVAVTNMRL